MSTEDNKALVRRFFEDGWNKQNLALVDELLSADYIDHNLPPGFPPTRDGFKQSASIYWSAFPDGRLTIEDQVAEGDTVVTRWSGVVRAGAAPFGVQGRSSHSRRHPPSRWLKDSVNQSYAGTYRGVQIACPRE